MLWKYFFFTPVAKLAKAKDVVVAGLNIGFQPLKRLPVKNVLTKMKTGTSAIGAL